MLEGILSTFPVEQVDRVQPVHRWRRTNAYTTPAGAHRSGTGPGKRSKNLWRISPVELIELYAKREAGGGVVFPADTLWQRGNGSFFSLRRNGRPTRCAESRQTGHGITQGRWTAWSAVTSDTGKQKLPCGPLSKRLWMANRVAVLVPTTILAQQHMNTFSERLNTFPVKVGCPQPFLFSTRAGGSHQQAQGGECRYLYRGRTGYCRRMCNSKTWAWSL